MKKILILTVLTILVTNIQAKVRLPHIIGDNMVLQQQTEARLWGWAKPGRTVMVSTSWGDEKIWYYLYAIMLPRVVYSAVLIPVAFYFNRALVSHMDEED